MNMRDRCIHRVRFPEENCETCLRAEVEKLRRVRDAAEAYRSVSTLRGYAAAQATWETLCAALDAIDWDD